MSQHLSAGISVFLRIQSRIAQVVLHYPPLCNNGMEQKKNNWDKLLVTARWSTRWARSWSFVEREKKNDVNCLNTTRQVYTVWVGVWKHIQVWHESFSDVVKSLAISFSSTSGFDSTRIFPRLALFSFQRATLKIASMYGKLIDSLPLSLTAAAIR